MFIRTQSPDPPNSTSQSALEPTHFSPSAATTVLTNGWPVASRPTPAPCPHNPHAPARRALVHHRCGVTPRFRRLQSIFRMKSKPAWDAVPAYFSSLTSAPLVSTHLAPARGATHRSPTAAPRPPCRPLLPLSRLMPLSRAARVSLPERLPCTLTNLGISWEFFPGVPTSTCSHANPGTYHTVFFCLSLFFF